jgi:hypothetical protein
MGVKRSVEERAEIYAAALSAILYVEDIDGARRIARSAVARANGKSVSWM